jgi:hypothetical protein
MSDFSTVNERETMVNVNQNLNTASLLDSLHRRIEYEVEGHPWASEEGCAPPMRRAHGEVSMGYLHEQVGP